MILDNDVALAHSVPLQARSQQMFCSQALSEWSVQRGMAQVLYVVSIVFSYWAVS